MSARQGTRWERRALAASLLFLAFLPGSPARKSAPPAPEEASGIAPASRHGRLSVHVTRDGAEVRGARVRIVSSEGATHRVVREQRTNEHGLVAMDELDEAAAWLLVDADGSARMSRALVVDRTDRLVDVALSQESTLSVSVGVDEGELPKRVDLEILGVDPLPRGARTDQAGHAEVHGLPKGPFTVTARAPGFESATVRDVTKGEVKLVLRRLGTVVARVTDEGRPASDARVFIVGADVWPPREARTDETGSVRIASLPRGPYALRATLGDERCSSVPVEANVEKGEATEVLLPLGRCGTLRVEVSDEEAGTPIVGASVTFVEDGLSPFPLRSVTASLGPVAVATIGPSARFAGSLSVDATGYVAKLVHVDEGRDAKVQLVRAGRLVGRVIDSDGRAIDGARLSVVGTEASGMPIDDDPAKSAFRASVFAQGASGTPRLVPAGELGVIPGPVAPIPRAPLLARPAGEAPRDPWISREHGTFTLDPVTPGTVRVVARHPEYVEGWSRSLTLAPGAEEALTLTLARGGAIEGEVEDARGHPIGGATIRVEDPRSGLERTTKTAEDGSFALSAVPENIALSVFLPRELSSSLRTSISVPEGKTEHVTLKLPEAREDASIRIADGRGLPIAMAQLTLVSLDPTIPLRITGFSNRDGEAILPGAVGLPGRLEISVPGFAARASSATLERSQRIALEPELTLIGEVRTRRGDRVARAEVSARGGETAGRGITNGDGEFEIPHVGTGATQVVVYAKGYGRLERTVAPKGADRSGRANLGRFELEEEAVVEGRVVDMSGTPVRGARVARNHVPVLPASAPLPPWVAVTDASGAFTLPALPSGELLVEAVAAGSAGVVHVVGRAGERTRDVVIRLGRDSGEANAAQGGVAATLEDANGELRVAEVAGGSSAERAGLREGDVIVQIDGKPAGAALVAEALLRGALGSDVFVAVERHGGRETLRIEREPIRR